MRSTKQILNKVDTLLFSHERFSTNPAYLKRNSLSHLQNGSSTVGREYELLGMNERELIRSKK